MQLERGLGGIKDMEGIPDVLFIVDVGHEKIAVSEAVKLGVPVVGMVDALTPRSIAGILECDVKGRRQLGRS